VLAEARQIAFPHRNGDASGLPWCAGDQAQALQRLHHVVDGGRVDAEETLHVGLGGRAAVDQGIGVDEGQVLALKLGESRRRRSCHAARDLIKGSGKEPA